LPLQPLRFFARPSFLRIRKVVFFFLQVPLLKAFNTFPAEDPDRDETYLIEKHQRYGHQTLIDHIGSWSENRRHDEIDKDSILAVPIQKGDIDQADLGQQDHENRQFEDHAEGDQQAQGKGKVLADGGQRGQISVVIAHQETKSRWKDDQIAEGGTAQETNGRKDGKRDQNPFFMPVETRGNESPDLGEDYRGGQEKTADQREF
jgi:hypothetical protein